LQLQLPENATDIPIMIEELHGTLSNKILNHAEAYGHTIGPLNPNNIVQNLKYYNIIGEPHACYNARKHFETDTIPNWGINNPDIMAAFFDHGSIKLQGTIIALKCGTEEWVVSNNEEFGNDTTA
jgi:hypothetical protein